MLVMTELASISEKTTFHKTHQNMWKVFSVLLNQFLYCRNASQKHKSTELDPDGPAAVLFTKPIPSGSQQAPTAF